MKRLTIVGLLLLAGCTNAPPQLAPIPAPSAVIVKVPSYISLPADATTPCLKPQARPIRTDVDLLKAAQAFAVWGECNSNKLKAIEAAQPVE